MSKHIAFTITAFPLALGLLAATPAFADVAGALCRTARGSHVDVLTSTYHDACLGHVENVDGKLKRIVTLPEPMSGDVRASEDLRVIVYIASYLPLLKHEALEKSPIVVRVYRDGALVKEQRLLDLVKPTELRQSISHVRFTETIAETVVNDQIELVMNGGRRVVLEAN